MRKVILPTDPAWCGPGLFELEEETRSIAVRLGVDELVWDRFVNRLYPLRLHAVEMYAHSLRVGVYAARLAEEEGGAARLALYGGVGHDIGKVTIPLEVIRAEPFGPAERKVMSRHPRAGFNMLVGPHPMTALVAGLHHTFQEEPYGIDLDVEAPGLSTEERKVVTDVAYLVSLCDFFDALVTRNDVNAPEGDFELVMHERFPNDSLRVWSLLGMELTGQVK